ncbi:MAG: DNA-binding protein YbiB [Leptothrix sp. (in: b-proteobacteria)]
MTIAPYLKTIGRGKDGARPLTREQAFDLMQRILAGTVSDLELGGFALAMRIKGETADELAAFVDAAMAHTLSLPALTTPAVLLPSYNGARKLPNLTPLLAMLLAREGVPVLVHGPVDDPGRVTSAAVFSALGLPPVDDADAARAQWTAGTPVFMAIDLLNPPLAKLLALRRVLGLRNSGHTIAKILPALPGALRVVNHTHPEYAISLSQYLRESGANAVLTRGTEGEPVADARRQPRMDVYRGGIKDDALSLAPQDGVLVDLPALPDAIDAGATARHIHAMLAGDVAVPAPITQQLRALVAACAAMRAR